MNAAPAEISVPCFDLSNRLVARVRIAAVEGRPESVRELCAADARQHLESRCQVREGYVYEYRIEDARSGWRVLRDRIVQPNAFDATAGRIDATNSTGLVLVQLTNDQGQVAKGELEVISAKLDYRTQYRTMIDDVASEVASLVVDRLSDDRVRMKPTTSPGTSSLVVRAEFLVSLIQSTRFRASVERILSSPERRLIEEERLVPITRCGRASSSLARQLVGSGRRQMVAPGHALTALGLSSVPTHVQAAQRRETVDIEENRFVRHVLEQFDAFLEKVERASPEALRLRSACRHARAQLESWLDHAVMRKVGAPQRLPIGSPVLQRRDGYRELLGSWILFNSTSVITWLGSDDVFSVGRRNLGALYEYWVFFKLLKVFKSLVLVTESPGRRLTAVSSRGVELTLKRGTAATFDGTFNVGRPLRARFQYNATFGKSGDPSQRGSWTRSMRPDFTFSIWPAEMSLEQAERLESTIHVHLDAKYKIERAVQVFGEENEIIGDDAKPDYTRDDLLKMHAYRDAIRRSYGAYVVYPGRGSQETFPCFHELLPGLGAFPLVPGQGPDGTAAVARFLREVLEHASERTSARERLSFERYRTHSERRLSVRDAMPELAPDQRRSVPPSERAVLVGWCRGDDHERWVRRAGLYNFRAGERRGALRLSPEVLRAEFVLLHGTRGALPGLLAVRPGDFRVLTRRQLLEEGYPFQGPLEDLYFVLDIEGEPTFAGMEIDIVRLDLTPENRTGTPTHRRLDEILAARAVSG